MKILYEDAHLLVVNKPAGLTTQGAGETLESLVRSHLAAGTDRDTYLGMVHRLDRPVSGVIAWAKTPKAARRLASQFAARGVLKEYWALVEGNAVPATGVWNDWLRDDPTTAGSSAVCGQSDPRARLAVTSYECRDAREPAWVVLRPETGRTHQLRAQCAARGMPIVGDVRYGATRPFPAGIALHARRLSFTHPMIERVVEVEAELPASWDPWKTGRW